MALELKFHHGVILIPILRAGIGMLSSFMEVFPSAPVGFFGIRRDEETALPYLYYKKVPPLTSTNQILLLDPMLATGGSACLALEHLKQLDPACRTIIVSFIAAPEGLQAVSERHSSTLIVSAAIDERLDSRKMIVPGLGDFGDRYFGTD